MKLINVEGISGAGKSSVIEIFKKELGANIVSLGGFNIGQYSTELTKMCRKLLQENPMFQLPVIPELHLLIAEILLDIEYNLLTYQNKDVIILYENYWESILFYEVAIAKKKYPDNVNLVRYIEDIFNISSKFYNIPKPIYSIYVECDIDTIRRRIEKRDKKFLSKIDIDILKEVNFLYKVHQKNNCTIEVRNQGSLDDLMEEVSSICKMEVFKY